MRTKNTKRQVTGLNWDNFDWGRFQTMSVFLGEATFPDCNFDPYLKQGQKQDGQDLLAFSRKNGKFLGLQCKREKKMGPSEIDKVIKEMLDGFYSDKLSDFILVTSADLESTKIQYHINEWKKNLYVLHGIVFDCWDRTVIEERLRKQWSIVEYYFGGSEADKLCYKQLKSAEFENIIKLNDFIPRTVYKQINHGDINDKLSYWRHFDRKSTDLKDVFLEDRLTTKRICLIGHSHFGKSFYIKHSAYELKNKERRFQPILLEIGKYSIQPIEKLLDTLYGAWKNIPYKDLLIIIDGLDEVPYEDFKKVLKYINEFSQAYRNLNILVSCRTVFFNRYNAAETLSLFEVYEFNQYDYNGIRSFLQNKLGSDLARAFERDIEKFNLRSLLFQPFYLINLSEEYSKPPHKLPGGRIQVLEGCVEKSFEQSRSRQTKGSDSVGLSSRHFKKLIAHMAFALQMAGRNSFTEDEMESLFSLEDRSLLQHNPLITIVGNSWSFTNALYQEHLAASLLAKMSFPEIKNLIAFGQIYPKIKTKWIQTVSSLLSFFELGNELFDQLLEFIENDNIEIIFQTESSKFSQDMQLVFIKKFMTKCREQNIRPVMVFEDYIGAFLENNKDAGDYLIEQIEDNGSTIIVKTVASRVLANMKIDSIEKIRFQHIALTEIKNTHDAAYAGELIEVFSKFGIGNKDTIYTLLSMGHLINLHPFRDSIYELIRILKLTDEFYQFGLEGIPAFLDYNKSISHGGSETNLQDLLLSTRNPKNLRKLLQKNPSENSFTYMDYRGSHKETFLRRLFDIYADIYKKEPSVIITISDFIKQVGKRYLRDEMNDIDRFLDKTGSHSLIVRCLVKDLMEDNEWEIGGLITPELYDYILFEFEEGKYSPQSLRNCWVGMHFKHKEKTNIDFYKLCDDAVGGEFERQEKNNEYIKYQQAEIKRRQNDIVVIDSLSKFKQGIRKYFKSFGKKSLTDEDIMIETDFRSIRINADSYFIFNYLLHKAPRECNLIYESTCLEHLDQPDFFEFFRANQILKYAFLNEEQKEVLLSILKTFYYEHLKNANFVNCMESKNDSYSHHLLPIMLGEIFTKFGFETEEYHLLDFLWLDTSGIRNFAEGYHYQQNSFSHKIIDLIPPNKISALKQKVVKNMRTGIKHELILGNHIALCKKFRISEVNDIILDAIYNAGSESTLRGDATEIYLELGGDPEKIFDFFRRYTSIEMHDYFRLAVIVSKINPKLTIVEVSRAIESEAMPESLRVHHAELLMELGIWKGFAIITNEMRHKKRALEYISRGRNVAQMDTQLALTELEDMIYLIVDPIYNNRDSIYDTAGNIIIDWMYQLAAKSEYDLELVTSYLVKSRDKLLKEYPKSFSTFNWMINYMSEKHRDSDKTTHSLKKIKQILSNRNDFN